MDSYVAYVEIGYLVAKLLPKLIAAIMLHPSVNVLSSVSTMHAYHGSEAFTLQMNSSLTKSSILM